MFKVFVIVLSGICVKLVSGQLINTTKEEVNNESEFKNLTNLENVFDVFDIRNVGARWNHINKRLSKICSQDTEQYLKGLQTGKNWAIKSK